MTYLVLFEDDLENLHMRPQFMEAHLAFLTAHSDVITDAGPVMAGDADDQPAGGVWLVKAGGRDRVQALVETDPFWPTGLRKSVRIVKWNRVFANGARL